MILKMTGIFSGKKMSPKKEHLLISKLIKFVWDLFAFFIHIENKV